MKYGMLSTPKTSANKNQDIDVKPRFESRRSLITPIIANMIDRNHSA